MKLFLCAFLTALIAFTAAAADVSGKWSGTYTFENGDSGVAFMVLKQANSTVSGTAGPGEEQQWTVQNGKIAGDKLTLELQSPADGVLYKIELTVSGDSLKGSVSAGQGGQTMKGKLEVARVKS